MDVHIRACALLAICLCWLEMALPYNIRNHPCCQNLSENLTLAMIIDAFEIYGHDPTDKLDNLWLYQLEMLGVKTAEDQFLINERVHIASDHLGRFVQLHVKELKVLLITLDDVIDNMLTMYENHNSIAAERKASYTGGPVPMEFYLSQEYRCGKNVYLFVSELYSDIYNMGKGPAPFCKDRSFIFLGFLHYHDEQKYYLIEDPSITFPTDNFLHGLECNIGICIFRFPFKKLLQQERDVVALPKAIVKCGLNMFKLPPLSAASCIIASGSFILDFNIQGLRYRHHDYLLTIPNGASYYTKEKGTPLVCDHHVCEWNYTNHYGGPFLIPGDPGDGIGPVPPFVETSTKPNTEDVENITIPSPKFRPLVFSAGQSPPLHELLLVWDANHIMQVSAKPTTLSRPRKDKANIQAVPKLNDKLAPEDGPAHDYSRKKNLDILEGCLFMYPPNYGSIAGKSYIDPVDMHDDRFTCNAAGNKGLYWYPQWMGAMPHHPYSSIHNMDNKFAAPPASGIVYPHQQDYEREELADLD